MKIKILGTRGEIQESAPYHSKKSCVLINDTLMLDIGDKRFLTESPTYILITHLHPDHAYFVRHDEAPPADVAIYAPEQYQNSLHVTKRTFHLDGYKITCIPTVHSLKVKSQAYLIEHNGKRILYTGDMIWIKKKFHKLLHNLDLIITEASFMRKGGMIRRNKATGKIYGHTGVPNLISMFKPFTCVMAFMHFGAWFYKDIKKARATFAQLAKEHDIEIIVGYDGLELELE